MNSVSDLFAYSPCFAVAAYDYSAIISFSIYIGLVFLLAFLSNRLRTSKSFLGEYFLGSRSLGVWAFALTFAATSASGGSFMGFPSLVYARGWAVALWIAGYMLVPIIAMGLLAKRINQFSRKTDAITIPDMLQARMRSSAIGVLATCFIIFFMIFNLVAQFKAGSKILQTLLSGIPVFDSAVWLVESATSAVGLSIEPAYVFCLFVFGVVVIAYTTYGGFRAVVWTDVLQGLFMVVGVLFMLPIALWAVGGLGNATQKMAAMVPPLELELRIENAKETIPKNSWLFGQVKNGFETDDGPEVQADDRSSKPPKKMRLFRVKDSIVWNEASNKNHVIPVFEFFDFKTQTVDGVAVPYFEGGRTIAITLESSQNGEDSTSLKPKSLDPNAIVLDLYADAESELVLIQIKRSKPKIGKGKYVSLPGYDPKKEAFLPMALAVSFFFFWTFSGAGQPSNMVRLMAFQGAPTLRRSIFTVCIYYSLIYFPLVVIFCCARVLLPGWETDSDRVMPEMAKALTFMINAPWLAGILVAAPFAAVMSTMDSFLLMISSSVVRDIYQRKNPDVSTEKIKRMTYLTTIIVGVLAMLLAVNPPRFLQDLIIFTGGGLSTTFLAPIFLCLYWKRLNANGAIAGMVGGFAWHCIAYLIGTWQNGEFSAYYLCGFDPFIPGTLISIALCWLVSIKTVPPDKETIRKFFYQPVEKAEPGKTA